ADKPAPPGSNPGRGQCEPFALNDGTRGWLRLRLLLPSDDGGAFAVSEELCAFDADAGKEPANPAGQIPVGPAHQNHYRGYEQAADDRGVEDHGHREPDAELLDGRVPVQDEAPEDEDHD